MIFLRLICLSVFLVTYPEILGNGSDACLMGSFVFQNIDVDQIVMEHYQTNGTPQSSTYKVSPVTPSESKDNITSEENCLPIELCTKCHHGFKVHVTFCFYIVLVDYLKPSQLVVRLTHLFYYIYIYKQLALCPEVANHLQEMKDTLIAISNELLDNASELSPLQSEKLQQERFVMLLSSSSHFTLICLLVQLRLLKRITCLFVCFILMPSLKLNKQIPLLEKYLLSLSRDEERQRSHYSASTATVEGFQSEIRPVNALRIDPIGQIHQRTDPESWSKCISSPIPFSSMDRFGVSSVPVEREAFTPKLIEVNYIEGSNDKRWANLDFPWTRKLEVRSLSLSLCDYGDCNSLIIGLVSADFALHYLFHSIDYFRTAYFRLLTKKYLETIPSVPIKER